MIKKHYTVFKKFSITLNELFFRAEPLDDPT